MTWRCADFHTIGDALRKYLDGSEMEPTPTRGAIAVACPVETDWVDITNQPWSFSIEQLRQDLGLEHLRVINDFTALAASIPRLGPEDTQLLKEGIAVEHAAIAVLGPGTGLGVSGLIESDGHWVPLSAEGGHTTLTATNQREWDVIEILREKFGRVSNERILSGPGLANLHHALGQIAGEPEEILSPAAVVAAATQNPGGRAAAAVRMFSGWLGTAAGDLVLSLGARGGVYLGGGVVPKMIDVFDTEYFIERFLDKGRLRSYVEPVPVHLILNTQIALVGAAAIVQED